MNARDAQALATLESSLPATDAREGWQDALQRMERRRNILSIVVVLVGGLPLLVGVLFGLVLLMRSLPSDMHIGFRVMIGFGGGGASAAMFRALMASIPGFGWAKELERISDAIAPYKAHLDWLEAKDRFV